MSGWARFAKLVCTVAVMLGAFTGLIVAQDEAAAMMACIEAPQSLSRQGFDPFTLQ